jgi:hypothetical protein
VPIAWITATLGSIVGTMRFTLERQQVADNRMNREASDLACNLSSGNSAADALPLNQIKAHQVITHRLKHGISETMSFSLPFDS